MSKYVHTTHFKCGHIRTSLRVGAIFTDHHVLGPCPRCRRRKEPRKKRWTNSIRQATKHLPEDVKAEIMKLWELAGCMDLDYPGLADYLGVIRSQFDEALGKLKAMKEAAAIVRRIMGPEEKD